MDDKISLPVINEPKYISPSSFKEWLNCQHKFYLKRMAGIPWVTEPQGLPAAVGSAFDAYLCASISEELGLKDLPEHKLEFLLETSVDKEQQDQAIPYAENLFKLYKSLGCYDNLLKEDITGVHVALDPVILEVDGDEVPIYCKPDLHNSLGTVYEIKVNGAFSKSGQSPKPGYLRYINNKYVAKGPHNLHGQPLEQIDSDWAIQLAMYTWVLSGIQPFRDIDVAVEQVAIRGETIAFASIRTTITASYQKYTLWPLLVTAWKDISRGRINMPTPNKITCHAFNSICPVAQNCTYYENTLGDKADPHLRELLS